MLACVKTVSEHRKPIPNDERNCGHHPVQCPPLQVRRMREKDSD